MFYHVTIQRLLHSGVYEADRSSFVMEILYIYMVVSMIERYT